MRDTKSNRAPSFTIMHFALILLCVVLITSYATGGLYAKYKSGTSDYDDARVIRFGELTLTEKNSPSGDKTWIVIPGVNISKNPLVSFEGSEASTFVFVEVTVSDGWTFNSETGRFSYNGKMYWDIAEKWNYVCKDGSKYVFSYTTERLIPNTVLQKEQIIKDGTVYVGTSITPTEVAAISNMKLTFRALAVQSSGFYLEGNPRLAAWQSLNSKGGH